MWNTVLSEMSFPASVKLVWAVPHDMSCSFSVFSDLLIKPKYLCSWQKYRASITERHRIAEDLFSLLS